MQDVRARFMNKVRVNPETGCHEWQAAKNAAGYGAFRVGDKVQKAHRVAYEMAVGKIPDSLVLDHLCRVRRCVNPAHLEPKTDRENLLAPGSQAIAKVHAEKSECPRGHVLRDGNLVPALLRRGWRSCLACQRARAYVDYRRRRYGIELAVDAIADSYYHA